LDEQWPVDAERMVERIDRALVGERPENGPPDIARKHLAAKEHHDAEQEQRDERQSQAPGEES
jgi:hypothetical protein